LELEFSLLQGTATAHCGAAIILSLSLPRSLRVAGLCYAEFSSMIPVAGSAYTYGYATLVRIVAWIIGWDLVWSTRLARPLCVGMERVFH